MRIIIVTILAIITFAIVYQVKAHDAPSGWKYPTSCCSNQDCREVSSKAIKETNQGYVIVNTGEVIPYNDPKIKDSPDGMFHWCSGQGLDNTHTICLFVPPRGY